MSIYDERGFIKNTARHKNGTTYDDDGFDKYGYNAEGFKADGYHSNGTKYNHLGFDINGVHYKDINRLNYRDLEDDIEITGTILGNVGTTNVNYAMDKFNTPRGHGFAAERANHLFDKLSGKDAILSADDRGLDGRILKNGADRIVNGVEIQSKYCKTGSKCIAECFENGKLKYVTAEGKPMQIEVPSDKYEDAVRAMENRIKNGEVKGVTDPSKAKEIVKKGHFTYEQAKNIAKFGTVESLTYDAVNGAIIATSAMGVSAMITFATSMWNGQDFEIALKDAALAGLKVGGVTFVTSILSSQLARTGLNSALRGSTDFIVKQMGSKAAAQIANAFRSGQNIYGAAAMNNVSKLLRGNAITGIATVVVMSSADVVNIFRGRISGAQLFKNVTTTATGVAGGTAGWVGGATAGAFIGSAVPIVGTAVGGFVGGLVGAFAGGSAATAGTKKVLDHFIEDDAKEMLSIIEKEFSKLAVDYLLTEEEAKEVVERLHGKLSGSTLKDMFSSSNKTSFAEELIVNIIEPIVKKRKKISAPKDEEMIKSLRSILEEETFTETSDTTLDSQKYDERGFLKNSAKHKNGTKYDDEGYDKYGVDRNGNKKGLLGHDDEDSLDSSKYDERGFLKNTARHKNGTKYDDEGYDKYGVDRNGKRRISK